MNVREVIERGAYLFGKRTALDSLWQEIGDNFYVERSDFTTQRALGTDFAAHLTSSYPLLVRRELGDQISAMLRPKGEMWLGISIEREDRLQHTDKAWLERASGIQYRAMYDNESGFVRATKEADHDWATFGQAVITPEINWDTATLLHRCWHLRDVVWVDDYAGRLCEVHRKWKCTPYDLMRKFRGKVHSKITERAAKEPYCDIDCMHVVMHADQYYDNPKGKYVSLVIDVENLHVMEEVQRNIIGYVIPRWKTVSGSQYAFSPATVIALPDARLIQSMALSILEAGEMSVRPPLITVPDAIREDVQYYAGGITKADIEADQQLQNVLAPILQDRSGFNFGLELLKDTRDMLASAFYINKLNLPPADKEMTAYETSIRVQEYIRGALPLFEPLETDYLGQLCEMDFQLLMSVGAFGRREEIPQGLRGQKTKFKFKNPLQQASDQKKGQIWQMAQQMTAEAAALDPSLPLMLDAPTAHREALEGIGVPIKWLRGEDDTARMVAQRNQEQEAMRQAQQIAGGAQVVQEVAKADQMLEGTA